MCRYCVCCNLFASPAPIGTGPDVGTINEALGLFPCVATWGLMILWLRRVGLFRRARTDVSHKVLRYGLGFSGAGSCWLPQLSPRITVLRSYLSFPVDNSTGGNGRCVGRPFKLIAGKRPVELSSPAFALRIMRPRWRGACWLSGHATVIHRSITHRREGATLQDHDDFHAAPRGNFR